MRPLFNRFNRNIESVFVCVRQMRQMRSRVGSRPLSVATLYVNRLKSFAGEIRGKK